MLVLRRARLMRGQLGAERRHGRRDRSVHPRVLSENRGLQPRSVLARTFSWVTTRRASQRWSREDAAAQQSLPSFFFGHLGGPGQIGGSGSSCIQGPRPAGQARRADGMCGRREGRTGGSNDGGGFASRVEVMRAGVEYIQHKLTWQASPVVFYLLIDCNAL
ncbi:hypothetical protein VTI28DRAFT_505 [Corynascus sepedonium]